ncbi:MAG: adenosylcobinamide-GDP ribazoletransferase [Candidatus Competibacteraceae bacterium]
MIRAFSLALQLLTRLPVPSFSTPPQPQELGQSVLFFPVVGLLIGGLLVGVNFALREINPGVAAALVLTVWVLITGGLHLDGLADTADAWIGGQGNRDRTLAIMKDPRSGPIALAIVALVLINKFAALQALLTGNASAALLLAPMLGRAIIVLLLLTTPYVRPAGLGAPYADYLPRRRCGLLIALMAMAMVAIAGWIGTGVLIGLGIGVFGLRQALMQRLGGITGDTLGAACELAETLALVMLALD